jgi:hypothetical protein
VATDGNSLGQSLLKDYGNCLSVYHGKGVLTLEDGKKYDCQFEAGQLNNGYVLLLCDFVPPFPTCLRILATKFEGTTSEGFGICSNKNINEVNYLPPVSKDRSSGTWAAFHLDEMLVQMADCGQTRRLHFGVTNFEFLGTERTHRSDNSLFHTLPLDLRSESKWTKLSIRPVDLYDKIIKRIKTLKSIDVSCEVIADIPTDGNIALIREAVEDLCYILSVARGTKIQWVYCDSYDGSGKLISRKHCSRITKPYCPLQIIHPISSGGRETKTFIEQTYKAYLGKRESYNLSMGAIDAYLDAKAEADYLEMRGIKTAVAMEILRSVFLELPDAPMKGYIIEEEEFKKLSPHLCTAIDEFLKTEIIDRDSRKAMCNDKKVLELNRRSFAYFLKKLCRHIDLRIGEDDIKLFVQCRNKLVHDGRFYCAIATADEKNECNPLPSKWHEYCFLINFLDKVFLKLLGYSGPYIDWRVPGSPTRQEQV